MAKRDLRSELSEFDGKYPESWIPKVDDILVGTVVRYESGSTEYGPCPIVVVEDEEKKELRSVWLLHAVLRSEFQKKRPRPGERVGIKRLPDAKIDYKRYALWVDREEPEIPDFSQFAPAGDVSPEDQARLSVDEGSDDLPF